MNMNNLNGNMMNGDPFDNVVRISPTIEAPSVDPEYLLGVSGLTRSTGTRAKHAQELAQRQIADIPIDLHVVNAEARKIFSGSELETGRRRVREHQANIADDVLDGHMAELRVTEVMLNDDIDQLTAAKKTAGRNRDDNKKLERDETVESVSWNVLSLVTAISIGAIGLFLIYSSLLIVQDLFYQLGRVDNKSKAIVLAPITAAAPFLALLIAIHQGEKDRKRFLIMLCAYSFAFAMAWILTIPVAVAPKSNTGMAFNLEPVTSQTGSNGFWYLSMVFQLIFEVLAASACKVGLHSIWKYHEPGGFRLTKLFKFFSRQNDALEVAIRKSQDAAAMIKAKIKKTSARIAVAQTIAENELDNRLKKLQTDMLDTEEMNTYISKIQKNKKEGDRS